MTRRGKALLAALIALPIAIVVWVSGVDEYVLRKDMLKRILELEDLPPSVSAIRCKSLFTTDLLWTCAFAVDSKDFPALVAKPCFREETSRWTQAHDFPMALAIGENFRVGHYYRAIPGCYSGGGEINVFASADKRHVLAHLYIE